MPGWTWGSVKNGSNLDSINSVTDENFTDVKTQIVGSLSDKTNMLKTELNDTRVSQDSNRTVEINARITEIQNLSAEINEASNASELKEIVFTFMQIQTVDSLEKEIERLQTTIGENENTSANMTELSNRITELTTLKEKISDASSLDDLKTIISSSQISSRGIPGMKDDMMKHARHNRFECQMNGPENMDDINEVTNETA
ncbi:MAG: hypothetical protein ACPK85_13235 [Methanosarcina sp.]